MEVIDYGPNMGKEFPSLNAVENFNYDGFGIETMKGFAKYTVKDFVEWTNDPGIGKFKCSDGKERLIPECQLTREYVKSLSARPKLDPFKGIGVFFGEPSHS